MFKIQWTFKDFQMGPRPCPALFNSRTWLHYTIGIPGHKLEPVEALFFFLTTFAFTLQSEDVTHFPLCVLFDMHLGKYMGLSNVQRLHTENCQRHLSAATRRGVILHTWKFILYTIPFWLWLPLSHSKQILYFYWLCFVNSTDTRFSSCEGQLCDLLNQHLIEL